MLYVDREGTVAMRRLDRRHRSFYEPGFSVKNTSIRSGDVKATSINASFSKYDVLLINSTVVLVSHLGTFLLLVTIERVK